MTMVVESVKGGERMEKLLSCEDVALRYSVEIATVWRWVREKKLTAIKTGKTYKFRPQDIERFEAENTTTGREPN